MSGFPRTCKRHVWQLANIVDTHQPNSERDSHHGLFAYKSSGTVRCVSFISQFANQRNPMKSVNMKRVGGLSSKCWSWKKQRKTDAFAVTRPSFLSGVCVSLSLSVCVWVVVHKYHRVHRSWPPPSLLDLTETTTTTTTTTTTAAVGESGDIP